MTAWAILTGNSSAVVGSTAWLHLNSQNTGTGSGIIITDGYEVEIEMLVAVSLADTNVSVELDQGVTVALNTTEIIVEVAA